MFEPTPRQTRTRTDYAVMSGREWSGGEHWGKGTALQPTDRGTRSAKELIRQSRIITDTRTRHRTSGIRTAFLLRVRRYIQRHLARTGRDAAIHSRLLF